MKKKEKIIIVMPGYKVERTLEKVYRDIPKEFRKNIIYCDNASPDNSIKVAKKLGLQIIRHKTNLGYGTSQKDLYKEALKQNADYVIMLHSDGQYDPKDLPKFVKALQQKKGDLILGSRFLGNGHVETPFYKSISIRFITMMFNLVLGINISEANTGYRGFTRKLLQSVPFTKNGSGYILDPQFIIQTVYFGFKIADVPVYKTYGTDDMQPGFFTSLNHGMENMILLGQYILQRLKLAKIDFLTL